MGWVPREVHVYLPFSHADGLKFVQLCHDSTYYVVLMSKPSLSLRLKYRSNFGELAFLVLRTKQTSTCGGSSLQRAKLL